MSKRPERSERLQVYLTPSSSKDKLVLDVWKAAKKHVRAQEFFRDILYRAIREAYHRGDIPIEIEKACGLSQRLPPPPQQQMAGAGAVPWFAYPQQGMPAPAPGVQPEPAGVVIEEIRPEPEPRRAVPSSASPVLPSRPAPVPARENTRRRFSSLMGE